MLPIMSTSRYHLSHLAIATVQIYNHSAMSSHHTIYKGWRDTKGNHVHANSRPLRHVAYHSPSGLNWGYGGSGPADLALSILAHYFNERPQPQSKRFLYGEYQCWQYHQRFKWDFVSAWKDNWTISTDEITTWLKKQNQPTLTAMAA